MRMWMVPTCYMCRKHLLGEHVEIHMLLSTIKMNKSIQGFLDNRLVEPSKIQERHDELVQAMLMRGYKHQSPIYVSGKIERFGVNIVNREKSLKELISRCADCKKLYMSVGKFMDQSQGISLEASNGN